MNCLRINLQTCMGVAAAIGIAASFPGYVHAQGAAKLAAGVKHAWTLSKAGLYVPRARVEQNALMEFEAQPGTQSFAAGIYARTSTAIWSDPKLLKAFAQNSKVLAELNKTQRELITIENKIAASSVLAKVRSSLDKKGISAKLSGMEEKVQEQVIAKYIAEEVARLVKSGNKETSWKNGAFVFKGQKGSFSYEQEISVNGLLKWIAAPAVGGVGATGAYLEVKRFTDNFDKLVQSAQGMSHGQAPMIGPEASLMEGGGGQQSIVFVDPNERKGP